MSKTARVPTKIGLFNPYIINTDNFLIAISSGVIRNYERLGISVTDKDAWGAFRLEWETVLYPAYSNVDTRTKTINNRVANFKKKFKDFANPVLDIIAASPAGTETDESTFNLVLDRNRKDPSRMTSAIEAQCFGTVKNLGGGEVKGGYRTSSDGSRASLAEGADSVQLAVKVGGPAPANPGDGTTLVLSRKSTFIYSAGMDKAGQRIYIYPRWYNTRYPQFAGPWGEVISLMLT